MAASINMKESKLAGSLISATAGYITGAAGEYISDAMPNTVSVISGMKSASDKVAQSITNADIFSRVRKFKTTASLRNVLRWYTDADNSFGPDESDSLSFDIGEDTDDATLAEVQYDSNRENADRISAAVIQSNQQLLEGQISLSAQIATSIDKQTGVITSGFDSVNSKLDSLIQIVTKNTSAIVEATVASNRVEDIAKTGKFSMDAYFKTIEKNIKSNPALGMAAAFMPMLTSPGMVKNMLSPDNLISMAFNGIVDKKAPNLKNNLKALDDAVNSTIVNALIRLGENKSNPLAKIFGINSTRQEASGQRSTLELKTVPFDSITKESITNAIPGYLRKILYSLSGEDVIYDYRSRTFRTQGAIKKEFMRVGQDRGTLSSASKRVQNVFGNDAYGSMLYDIVMADLGEKQSQSGTGNRSISKARETIAGFSNRGQFERYITKLLEDNGVIPNANDRRRFQQIGNRMSSSNAWSGVDMSNQVARTNLTRNQRLSEYVKNADAYNVDLSELRSSTRDDIKNILKENGLIQSSSTVRAGRFMSGTDYSNKALYEIYKILDRGINVYQLGSSASRAKAFKMKNALDVPAGYRTGNGSVDNEGPVARINAGAIDEEDNLLRNNTGSNGAPENLSKSARFKRWAGRRGGELSRAIFSGNPDDVVSTFAAMGTDIAGVAKDSMISGIEKINTTFGNVSGYLKHKMFGTGYEYKENGQTVRVKENENGGIFGYISNQVSGMFNSAKSTAGNWFNSVKGYFDYGDSSEDQSTKSKRKQFMSASVGAMAGAGLLGGPLGLIMGGVAGSAIGILDIGSKIHDMLFGRNEHGKATGLLTKLGDNVIDPIKYQFEKTAHSVGNALKKNILGPLSDIGFVIKERIANAADSTFGKFFGFIGRMITEPFKAIGNTILNVASLPITLAGMAARTVFGVESGMAGAGLNTAAGVLAFGNRQTADVLRERRRSRNADIKSNSKFQSYKDWKTEEDSKKAARLSELQASMAEETEVVADNTSNINRNLEDLHYHATHTDGEHSIFTHDDGLHNKVDRIIDIISRSIGQGDGTIIDGTSGAKMSTIDVLKQTMQEANVLSNDNGMASSGITAAAMIAAEGDITSDDKKEVNAIITEAQKRNSSTSIIRTHLNRLMSSQEESSAANKEKTDSLWNSLLKNIGGIGSTLISNLPKLAGIAALISGISSFLGSFNLQQSLAGFSDDVAESIKNLLFGDGDESTSDSLDGVNTVAALSDNHVESTVDLANPLASIYHNQKDANGDWIVDQATTDVKGKYQLTVPLVQQTQMGHWNTLEGYDKVLNSTDEATQIAGGEQYLKGQEQIQHAGSSTVKNLASGAAKVGIATLGGKLIGTASGAIAKNLGADEETAQRVSSLGTRAGTAGLILQHGVSKLKGQSSIVDTVLGIIKKGFSALAKALRINKKLANVASKVDSFFDGIYNKTVGKMTDKLANKIASMIAAKTGVNSTEQLVSAVTLGIGIAVAGITGLISGYCGTEYLFGVLPGQADGVMKTISSILTAAFTALEATPAVGFFVVGLEVFDELVFKSILRDDNGMGHTLKSYIAMWLYKLLAGEEGAATLKEKQAALATETNVYNEKYGANVDINAFNDMVNRNGILSTIMHGKTKYGADGHIKFDAAGKLVEGGLTGFAQNGETLYNYDANGAVLRREDGSAVERRDANGNIITVKADGTTTTKSLRNTWNNIKGFFTGKDIYETDENGEAKVDENGNYIVKEHRGIFGIKSKNTSAASKIIPASEAAISESADSALEEDEKTSNKTASNKTKLEAAQAKLTSLAKDGKYDEIIKYTLSLDKDDPTYGTMLASFMLSKRMAISSAILNSTDDNLYNMASSGTSYNRTRSSYSAIKSAVSRAGGPTLGLFGVSDMEKATGVVLPQSSSTSKKSTSNSKNSIDANSQNPLSTDYSITSGFGQRETPRKGMHEGIDLIPMNGTMTASIKATMAGTVESVKNNVSNSLHAVQTSNGYTFNGSKDDESGNTVVIRGDNGLTARFMHLKQGSIPSAIKKGAKVTAWTKIGEMGNTGWSTGPHLHFQMNDSKDRVFDPTPYVKGVSPTMMNYKYADTVADTYTTTTDDAASSNTAITDTSSIISTDTTTTENKGLIGTLLEKLSSFGSNLLFKITGGLYGSSSDSSSSSSSYFAATGVSDQVSKLLNVARSEIGYKGPAENRNKYNDWFYGSSGVAQPWCMAFVQWCYNQAGYPMDCKSASCLAVWNHYQSAGKTHTGDPRPGDIWIKVRGGGGHTGIVDSVDGSTFYTIEGNTGNDTVSKVTHKIGESTTKGFITLLDQTVSSTTNIMSAGTVTDTDVASLWQYFRKKGWSDKAIAGALGCWTSESGTAPNRIEGDYTAMYKSMSNNPYVDLINNRDLMDTYARGKLLPNYRHNTGLIYRDANYKGNDGHYYVGLGMAQWTAQRGKNLLDFAKANNIPWDTRDTQLKFMEQELTGSYRNVLSNMEATNSVADATHVFMNQYEGNKDSTGYFPPRKANAESLYAKYAGKYSGGPTSTIDMDRYADVLRDPRTGEILEVQDSATTKSQRVGGPSSIGRNVYTSKPYRQSPRGARYGGPTITGPSVSPSNTSVASTTAPATTPIVTTASSGTDLSGVVSLLSRTVEELVKITNNTASSSTLLGSINDKDFVDQGLRDSIAALKNVKTSKSSTIPKPTASSVTAMAKP